MPFDGLDFPRREFMLNKLDRVVQLVDSEDKWSKGQFLSWDGRRCVLTALYLARAKSLLEPVILASARDVTGLVFNRVDRFNDHPTTDHALVMAVLDRAHERILTGQIPPWRGHSSFLSKVWGLWSMQSRRR